MIPRRTVPDRTAPVQLGKNQRRAARLVVCRHARDAKDAARLLDVLGLMPDLTDEDGSGQGGCGAVSAG